MAYTPPYAKSSAGSGEGGEGRAKSDRLVEVVDYDLKNGILYARDTVTEANLAVKISRHAAERAERSAFQNPKFVGGIIDHRMAKAIPKEKRTILEGVLEEGPVDQNGWQPVNATWIHTVNPNPDKTLAGIFTLDAFQDRVRSVQLWSPKALTAERAEQALTPYLEEQVARHLMNEANQDNPEYQKQYGPGFGFMLRAVSADGVVLETVEKAAWNRAVSRPISADDLKGAVGGFSEYVKDRHPGAVVEVLPFKEFSAGNMYALPANGPIRTMATARSKSSPDDPDLPRFGGGILAVQGILQLSPGRYNPTTGQLEGAERQIALTLHASARKFHIAEMVKGPNNEPRRLAQGIDVVYVNQRGQQNTASKGDADPQSARQGQGQGHQSTRQSPPPTIPAPAHKAESSAAPDAAEDLPLPPHQPAHGPADATGLDPLAEAQRPGDGAGGDKLAEARRRAAQALSANPFN